MMTRALSSGFEQLPWSASEEENRRFNRFLFAFLFPALLAGAIIPQLPVQEIAEILANDEPVRKVKLAFEPPPPEPPPPVIEPSPLPTPVVAPTPAPEPAAASTSAARTQQAKAPVKKPVDRTAELKKSLQNLRQNPNVLASLSNRPLKQAVSSDQPQNERLSADIDQGARVTGQPAPQRKKGQYDLSGHDSTRVTTPAASSGQGTGNQGRRSGGGGSGRSSQEIQSVFERQKAAINAIYERALRDNPELAGKLVLRLTILPSGKVSDCRIISDQLGDASVADRVVRRVKLLDFGAKSVPTVTTDYPIEFFPR